MNTKYTYKSIEKLLRHTLDVYIYHTYEMSSCLPGSLNQNSWFRHFWYKNGSPLIKILGFKPLQKEASVHKITIKNKILFNIIDRSKSKRPSMGSKELHCLHF